MSTRSLPPRPNLDQLKLQARELHRAHRDGTLAAAARIVAHHPEKKRLSLPEALDAPFALADAQLVIAREYGFDNWSQLKHRVELGPQLDQIKPHPRFAEALAALDAGDADGLRARLASDPSLVHARTNLDPPYGYFTAATLLHHVAGNPGRDRHLPANIVEIARLLLDAGADVSAVTLGPAPSSAKTTHGSTTMGLVVTSKQASDMNVAGPLIDLLLARGARLDVKDPAALDASLANHAPRAAEKMIELGAKPDVLAAAALGPTDLLRSFFDREGKLLSRPIRGGKEMTVRDAIGLALLYAYVRQQRDAVDFLLEKDGNWDMTGVNNGTALHRAAWSGDLDMVQRLVARGAGINNRDNPFHGTPMGWAEHNKQHHVVEWIQKHCPVDIHDAVAFDLLDHVDARLRDDPGVVNKRIDDYVPQGTPLHVAAQWNHVKAAELLIARGASRDLFDASGRTPLDVADAHGSSDVAAVLHARGSRRAADAPSRAKIRAQPLYRIDDQTDTLHVRPAVDESEWDEIAAVMAEKKITGLDANGQMTDGGLARIARVDHITRLQLGGSKKLTDDGLKHLAALSRLEELDLSDYPGGVITDRGLEVLRALPELERFQMSWQRGVSDVGASHLSFCDKLERVDLMGTHTGDGVIKALAGKTHLHHLKTGRLVTDAVLPLLHTFPVFKKWQGGEIKYSLMGPTGEPNHLTLDGPFTNVGLTSLIGLDGLFGVSFFWHISALTAEGLKPLAELPNLGFLGCEGHLCDDVAMRHIAAMPRLRMLMAQGTVASDDGFTALSRSGTIEYVWGRECPNLTGRGFRALSTMPALRGFAVSCKNVDDASLSTLPRFPSLRQLLPMDVLDDGFRHIGQCRDLENLWCMYCRQTTDKATEHIGGLSHLKTYYAGQTMITDRSLEILAPLRSLERIQFESCPGITNAGLARLAQLPHLREIQVVLCRQVTADMLTIFPAHVRVKYSA